MSIATLAQNIDYGKLARELNKVPLAVTVKQNVMLPKLIVQASQMAKTIIPIGVMALAGLSIASLGMLRYQMYRAEKNKDKKYPEATLENIKQAHTVLQQSKSKLDNDKTFTIAGRQNATDTLRAWRESMLSFINTDSDKLTKDTKMVKSNFMFYGPTGTGKTYACEKIAKDAGFELRQLPSASNIQPGISLSALITTEGDNYRKYFKSLLKDRKNGKNIALLIDEADQYITPAFNFSNTQDHEFNMFIEALQDHCIPVIFTSNNPAKFEKRTIRRALNFDLVDYNNIDVSEKYTYTDKKGQQKNYNGMNCAVEIVQDIFNNRGIDLSKILQDKYKKIVDACCDTKSRYLKDDNTNDYKDKYENGCFYTTQHGDKRIRANVYKPLSMTAVDTFAKLLLQKGATDENVEEIIQNITPESINTTDSPVDPNRNSGVGIFGVAN